MTDEENEGVIKCLIEHEFIKWKNATLRHRISYRESNWDFWNTPWGINIFWYLLQQGLCRNVLKEPILPKQRNFITRFHWEIQLLVVAFFDLILTVSSWAQLSEETDTCFTFYTSCTIIRFIWNSQDVWFDIYWYFIEWFFQDFAAFEDLAIRSQINGFSLVGSKPVGF